MKKLITLPMPPISMQVGLLVLRVWLGLTMLLVHGLDKLQNFSGTVQTFQENMGIPAPLGAAAIFAESICAALLVVGLATRWAALFLSITMAVAFFKAHGASLATDGGASGEMAFIYLAGFLTLFLAGAGRFSADAMLSPTPRGR